MDSRLKPDAGHVQALIDGPVWMLLLRRAPGAQEVSHRRKEEALVPHGPSLPSTLSMIFLQRPNVCFTLLLPVHALPSCRVAEAFHVCEPLCSLQTLLRRQITLFALSLLPS